MASSGVNVLRYSALFAGLGYGYYHQQTVTARDEKAHLERENHRREGLIAKAKAEWIKKTMPDDQKDAAISDPDDPKFDLEAFLKLSEAK